MEPERLDSQQAPVLPRLPILLLIAESSDTRPYTDPRVIGHPLSDQVPEGAGTSLVTLSTLQPFSGRLVQPAVAYDRLVVYSRCVGEFEPKCMHASAQ